MIQKYLNFPQGTQRLKMIVLYLYNYKEIDNTVSDKVASLHEAIFPQNDIYKTCFTCTQIMHFCFYFFFLNQIT